MKIVINDKTYTTIEDLKFDPTADVTGTSVPINEFSCSIKTTDDIEFGSFAKLYDDNDILWANYWITEVEHPNNYFVYIIAQSMLLLLDRTTLGAQMVENVKASDFVASIFQYSPKAEYILDDSFKDVAINGFCPEQSAKDRLQWVCFILGAYMKTFFADKIYIMPLSDASETVPINKVFWRPSVTYNDIVTAVKVRAFSYTLGTPGTTDDYVTPDDSHYYIQTTQVFTLKNQDAPETAAENVVEISDVTLVNGNNVSEILSRLAKYYFKRVEVSLDIIDDGTYLPGDMINVPIDNKGQMATGHIQSASFSFGHAQKASITMRKVEVIGSVEVIVTSIYNGREVEKETYYYPAGTPFMIENRYIETVLDGNKHVLMPELTHTEGVAEKEVNEVEADYVAALKQEGDLLYIYIVDDYSTSRTEKKKEMTIS